MAKRARKRTKAELASPEFQASRKRRTEVLILSFEQCNKLSKARLQFVLDVADDQWTYRFPNMEDEKAVQKEERNWAKLRQEFVATAMNPLEIHCFTCNYNALRGMKPLVQLINNDHCDAGTALRLYWANDPYSYREYRTVADCDYPEQKDAFRLLRAIERKFKHGGFASRQIPFDPEPWFAPGDSNAASLSLPDSMTTAISPHTGKRS
jgi:hypothetical protein